MPFGRHARRPEGASAIDYWFCANRKAYNLMPMGYDYRCNQCGHTWLLFSKRFTLGPVQWGETRHTCYSCQTFLSIASSVDSKSWSNWLQNNEAAVKQNSIVAALAESIDTRLKLNRGVAPITLEFHSIECPTCRDAMSTVPFGQQPMKCPKCGRYTGESEDSTTITIYE